MTATEQLLGNLRSRGVTVTLGAGGTFVVAPKDALTDADRAQLRRLKPYVVRRLAEESAIPANATARSNGNASGGEPGSPVAPSPPDDAPPAMVVVVDRNRVTDDDLDRWLGSVWYDGDLADQDDDVNGDDDEDDEDDEDDDDSIVFNAGGNSGGGGTTMKAGTNGPDTTATSSDGASMPPPGFRPLHTGIRGLISGDSSLAAQGYRFKNDRTDELWPDPPAKKKGG